MKIFNKSYYYKNDYNNRFKNIDLRNFLFKSLPFLFIFKKIKIVINNFSDNYSS